MSKLFSAVLGCFCLFAGSIANGAVVVDQEQPLIDSSAGFLGIGGDSEQKLAQSFTVGFSGSLVGLRLPIAGCGSGELVIELREMDGGNPTGPVIRTIRVSPADVSFSFAGFTDFFFPAPLPVNAGDVYAFTVRTEGDGSFCSYATPPSGELYPRGSGFFDARPNPPGWVTFKEFPEGPQDLPFFTLMDDPAGGGSSENCVAQTSGGAVPLPIDAATPVCRCFEDLIFNELRCGILHPDFFIVRRIPFPLPPGRDYVERWQFTPLTDLDGPVYLSISGGGLQQGQKFEFKSRPGARRTMTRSLKAIAPKEALDVKGLAVVNYEMKDAQSEFEKAFGIDTTIYADQVGQQ